MDVPFRKGVDSASLAGLLELQDRSAERTRACCAVSGAARNDLSLRVWVARSRGIRWCSEGRAARAARAPAMSRVARRGWMRL